MKINKTKLAVTTLAIAMGAALAGSISGSVAWYQYSTRAAAQITGTSAGTLGDLTVSLDGGAYSHKVSDDAGEFRPMSAKGSVAGSLEYFKHPVYQYETLPALSASEAASYYTEYELSFKFEESDGTALDMQEVTGKKVYLSYFAIEDAGDPIYSAVRVEIIGTHKYFFSANASGETTNTKGTLDIGGATGVDTDNWDCSDVGGTAIQYQNDGSASYATQAHSAGVLTAAEMADPYSISAAKDLTTTGGDPLVVRVWIEGWASVGGKTSWGSDVLGQTFNIDMQFTCEANQ